MFQHLIQQLTEGTSYQQLLIHKSAEEAEAKSFSSSAALLEIALSAGALEEIEESQARRSRAQSLRMMDREAETLRRRRSSDSRLRSDFRYRKLFSNWIGLSRLMSMTPSSGISAVRGA